MKVDGQQPLYANWLSMGVLNAYASLIFGRGMSVGLLVLGASCFDFGAGTAGVSAALASFCTTVALGYRRDVTLRGHFGFNAVLCGLALGHGHPVTPLLLIKAAVLGSVAAMLTASLSELLDTKLQLPVLALPYVLVTSLLGLVGGTGYATAHDTFAYVPDLPVHLPALVADTLRSFGSIIYAPTTAAGLLVFLAATLTSRFLAGIGV